jgi:hypothetical protein
MYCVRRFTPFFSTSIIVSSSSSNVLSQPLGFIVCWLRSIVYILIILFASLYCPVNFYMYMLPPFEISFSMLIIKHSASLCVYHFTQSSFVIQSFNVPRILMMAPVLVLVLRHGLMRSSFLSSLSLHWIFAVKLTIKTQESLVLYRIACPCVPVPL